MGKRRFVCFSFTLYFEIRAVLFDLDAADVITDLHDIGAVQFNPDDKRA